MAGIYEGAPRVDPQSGGIAGAMNISTPNVPDSAFGGGSARALGQLGNAIVKQSEFWDTAAADDANNTYQENINKILHGDPEKGEVGYMGLKGRAALDQRPIVAKQMEDLRNEAKRKLITPAQRERFDGFSRRYKSYAEGIVGRHSDQQFNTWASQVNSASQKQALDHIAGNADNPEEVLKGYGDLLDANMKQAELNGGGPELYAQAESSAKKGALAAQLQSIGVKDPLRAMRILDQNKTIAGTDYDNMANHFRVRAETQEGREVADGVLSSPGAPPPNGKDSAATIRHFEGFRPGAYYDKNAWRTGYGSDTVTRANGKVETVTKETRVTQEDAERDLNRRLGEFQTGIKDKIGEDKWKALSDETRSSLTSIAYNYGKLPTDVAEAAKTGDPDRIANSILKLANHNGGINANRRASEAGNVLKGNAEAQSLKMNPQEQNLYQHHLDNLAKGGVQNEDGTKSTALVQTVGIDGKTFLIPTVWDNKIVSPDQAIENAKKAGLDKFPSYATQAEADKRYDQIHKAMERDEAPRAPPTQNELIQKVMSDPALADKPQAQAAAVARINQSFAKKQDTQIRQRTAFDMGVKDSLAEALNTGTTQKTITASDFVKHYGESAGAAKYAAYTADLKYSANYKSMQTMPNTQMDTFVNQQYDIPPGSPGYADSLENADKLRKSAHNLQEQRRADPAGSVDRMPAVMDALKTYDQNNPDSFKLVMDARLKAQEALGIEEEYRSPISLAEAKKAMSPLALAPPTAKDQTDAIRKIAEGMQKQYGDQAQRALSFAFRAYKVNGQTAENAASIFTKLGKGLPISRDDARSFDDSQIDDAEKKATAGTTDYGIDVGSSMTGNPDVAPAPPKKPTIPAKAMTDLFEGKLNPTRFDEQFGKGRYEEVKKQFPQMFPKEVGGAGGG